MFRKFLRRVMKTFFGSVTIEGLENLPDDGAVIFLPNHPNSLIDALMGSFIPQRFKRHFVAKAPLFKIPILGRILKNLGAIPVVRKHEAKGKVDYSAFFGACVDVLENRDSIVIYPEGASLPQPYLAAMKTGPARLFFLAKERGVKVTLIPIGLNYEQRNTFRSSVVMSIGPAIDTSKLEAEYEQDERGTIKAMTKEIGTALAAQVFQSETFDDSELMLLLERTYKVDCDSNAWQKRVARLKKFEEGLKILKDTHPEKIDGLRKMLTNYQRVSASSKRVNGPSDKDIHPIKQFFLALAGFPLAGLGWLFSILPYKACDIIVKKVLNHGIVDQATSKVLLSLFLFPLAFVLEGLVLCFFFGWFAFALFLVAAIPLAHFTLFYFEWLNKNGGWLPSLAKSNALLLDEQKTGINDFVDGLVSDIDEIKNP